MVRQWWQPISALGAHCDFISVVGCDSTAELVRQQLAVWVGDGLSTDYTADHVQKRYVVQKVIPRQPSRRAQPGCRGGRSSYRSAADAGATCSGDSRFGLRIWRGHTDSGGGSSARQTTQLAAVRGSAMQQSGGLRRALKNSHCSARMSGKHGSRCKTKTAALNN